MQILNSLKIFLSVSYEICNTEGMVRRKMTSGIDLLDSSDIQKIKDACIRIKVSEGEELIAKGDSSDHLYIVAEGSFKVHDETLEEDFVHAILESGAIFGEMSFIDGGPRSASVEALSEGTLLKMGKSEFDGLLASSPDTAMLLIFTLARVITGRLRDVNIALRNMTFSEHDRDREKVLKDVISKMKRAAHIHLKNESGGEV